MRRSFGVGMAVAAVLAAGCSAEERTPPSPECVAGEEPVLEALAKAPGEVRLVDGTAISDCVRLAYSDAELQNLGIVLTGVAEDLEARAPEDKRAAGQLGYLIGAARKGAPGTERIQSELVRRLERSAAIDLPPASQRALADGMRAGERDG